MYKRLLSPRLPEKQSIFLWGPYQSGKSSYLKNKFSKSVYYDLLSTREFVRFSKEPYLIRDELLELNTSQKSLPIIIDEIQKVPELLDEVHWLIENEKLHFILCGSSARQLKKPSTNLLGGRAWLYKFYPLLFPEIDDFELLRALQHGLLPKNYLAKPSYINDYLENYIDVYLTSEIKHEGLVRNLPNFARFLDIAGLTNGEIVNATNIARDCGVGRNTVQSYYEILIDTMLGYFIYPYHKKIKRNLITSSPKFYFFDVGIANYLAKQAILALHGSVAGRSLEHYILMELIGYIGINKKRTEINYWRTKTGLEVDFIINSPQIAIEVKISRQVKKEDIKGLVAFSEEHPLAKCFVVSQDERPRLITINGSEITILPWKVFLERLWGGDIF